MSFKRSLSKNIIAIITILLIIVYITTIYSPCPQGELIHTQDRLQKFCLAKDRDGIEKKHGPWVSLYPSGRLKERGEYLYGEKNGHWVYWYDNGRKKSEGDIKNGQANGQWSHWDIDGNKKLRQELN